MVYNKIPVLFFGINPLWNLSLLAILLRYIKKKSHSTRFEFDFRTLLFLVDFKNV